ncbi:hypothetical protein ABIA13_005232 [Sinorhizobium fredii]
MRYACAQPEAGREAFIDRCEVVLVTGQINAACSA